MSQARRVNRNQAWSAGEAPAEPAQADAEAGDSTNVGAQRSSSSA